MSAKKYIEGRLGFNEEENRYGLLISDLWEHNFHCGENLEVKNDNGEWVKTRMEMKDNKWYLKGTNLKGEDLEYQIIRVEVE